DALNIASNENIFQDVIKELVQTNDIIFSSSSSTQQQQQQQQPNKQKIIRITNPLLDTYLKPLISSNDAIKADLT
ncbi:unnamed protein product, partial [Rotaria socialis]